MVVVGGRWGGVFEGDGWVCGDWGGGASGGVVGGTSSETGAAFRDGGGIWGG